MKKPYQKIFDTFGPARIEVEVRVSCRAPCETVYCVVDDYTQYASFRGGKDPNGRAERYAARLRRSILGFRGPT